MNSINYNGSIMPTAGSSDIARVYPIGYPLTFGEQSNSSYIVELLKGKVVLTIEEYNRWVDLFDNWIKHEEFDMNDRVLSALAEKNAVLVVRRTQPVLELMNPLTPCRQGFGAESKQRHSIALAATHIYPTADEWKVWQYSDGLSSIADIREAAAREGMSHQAFFSALCGLSSNNLIYLR